MRKSCMVLFAGLILSSAPVRAQTVLPEWVGRQAEAWRRTRAPQIGGRVQLFQTSRGNPLPDGDALLVCRVHVDGRWDLFGNPDLAVRLRAGSAVQNVWGTENSRTEVFTFPGVNARRGLSFRIVDRDVTFDETIATVSVATSSPPPFTGSAGQADVECRVVDPSLIEPRTGQALAVARRQIAVVEEAHPDLQAQALGRPSPIEARQRLVAAAAWGGWSHADVAAERRRLEHAEEAFETAARAAVADAYRGAARPRQEVSVDGAPLSFRRSFRGAAAARQVPADACSGCTVRRVLVLNGHISQVDVLDRRAQVHAVRAVIHDDENGTTQLLFDHRFDARRAVLRAGASRDVFLRLP